MKKINRPDLKKQIIQNKDQELEKLERITEGMRNINDLLKRTEKDDERFEELTNQLFEIESNNQYVILFKFCVAFIDNFHLRRINLLMENHVNALKTMIETGVENRNEVSDLRTKVLEQYDKTKSALNYSNYLFELRNNLMDIAYEANVLYPPFKKEYEMIHKKKIRTKEAEQFAFSLLHEIKTKKSSFLILIYQNREESKFLRVFPKLKDFDFNKLNNRYGNKEFESVVDEYFIKFGDSLKPSKKKKVTSKM